MIKKSYEIQKSINNFISCNIFLLYGENYGLKKDIRESIKNQIIKKEKNVEYLTIFENDINSGEKEFYNSIYSGSLFGSKKIITVQDGSDKIFEKIKDVIKDCPENISLIIFSGLLEKKSKLRNLFEKDKKALCVPCYSDNDRDLEIIINSELHKNSINLSRESINLLIEKSNKDRNNLKNEIEKIKSFSLSNKNIEVNELKSIINFSGDYEPDALINECLSGNILQYKKILSELYSNAINQIFFLRILSNKIHRLISIKKLEYKSNNIDSLLNSTKPPIFWKDKPIIKKQLTIWSLKDLLKTINEINHTELLCKKNPQISKVLFFNFFTKICKKANNYF